MRPQITTLTLNSAVDLACTATSVRRTHKIRTFDGHLDPGGGGINVARVVHALGGDALALIMTGGVTGRLVEELLDEAGVHWKRLPIAQRTRISLNVHERQTGLEYRFVPEGPKVEEGEWFGVLEVLRDLRTEWIVASGSLPRGIPSHFYSQAAAIGARNGQKFVLDTSGPALRSGIGRDVELLKLGLSELGFLVGHELDGSQSQEKEIAVLIRQGAARMVALSLGRDGAILATRDCVSRLPALAVEERRAVGAGDGFLAGLVPGLARGLSHHNALALATAAGAAVVSSYGTARVQRADVDTLYSKLCHQQESAYSCGS